MTPVFEAMCFKCRQGSDAHKPEVVCRGGKWSVELQCPPKPGPTYHRVGEDDHRTGGCALCPDPIVIGDEIEIRAGGRIAAHRACAEKSAHRDPAGSGDERKSK